MIRLHLLGSLQLRAADGTEMRSVLAQPKRVALLAYLAIAMRHGFHRRDTLLGLFWPELDEEHARGALSQAIYRLRRDLGDHALVSRGKEEIGVDPRILWCDAMEFEAALDAGSTKEALELYRGDLLAGFFISGAPEWERWLEEERGRVRDRAAAAAWTLAEQAAADRDASDAAHWGRRALALGPGDEVRLRKLILLLDELGDRAGAVRVYEECAERLARQYEIELAPETQSLMADVKARVKPGTDGGPSPARGGTGPHGASPPATEARPARAGHARRHRWRLVEAVLGSPAHHQPTAGGRLYHTALSVARQKKRLVFLGAAVLTAGVLVAGSLLWPPTRVDHASQLQPGEATLGTRSHLAVLPMANSTTAVEDAYLAEGFTEELISSLSGLGDLRVIAGTSVMAYRGTHKSIAEIGDELGVGTLLTGSVRNEDGRVHITVQLVDARSQERLWAEDYEAEVGAVPRVQRAIAEQVAAALLAGAPPREPRRLGATATEIPEAYTEYLKGRYFLAKLDGNAFTEARNHFERALDLDPTFARSWSGLSNAYINLSDLMVLPAGEAYPRARAAAERALELDPELAEAHAVLAMALSMYYWDTKTAERHFRQAIELEPSSARSRRLYAAHLRNLGRFEEALSQVRRSKELDPLFAFTHVEEGIILYLARRNDEALEKFQQFLRVAPGHSHVYVFIAMVHRQKGQYEEALAALRETDPQMKRPDAQAIRGAVYARMGRHEDARQMLALLDELSREQETVSPFHKATIHVALGEHDRALDLLEEAAEEPTWQMRLLKVSPGFDPLRTDPRFQALLARVGLSP